MWGVSVDALELKDTFDGFIDYIFQVACPSLFYY